MNDAKRNTSHDENVANATELGEVCSSYSVDSILEMVNSSKGEEIHTAKPYGVGIDTARDFIDVTVTIIVSDKCFAFYRRFDTDWNSLVMAKQWTVMLIENKSVPTIRVANADGNTTETFHYCIESTGNYHKSVLYAWGGSPSVVNPSIAGAAKKKTDRLDSKMLSIHDMTGVWNVSYIPSLEIEAVRQLISEREYASHMMVRISNRINSTLLRFGFTVGRDGSVTKSQEIRSLVENIVSDEPELSGLNVCNRVIPMDIRLAIREQYNEYDRYHEKEAKYDLEIRNRVGSMYWETGSDVLIGEEMLALLTTVPGIGEKTACTWLAQIGTPRRFHSANAVSAYCGTDPSLKISADKVVSTKKRGGNVHLHHALCTCASNLMRAKSEPFGRWGANIYARSNKWKKGTNAVARKLAVALYIVQLRGEVFSYDKYTMCQANDIIDMPITEFAEMVPGFKRYIRILNKLEIKTTQPMVVAYNQCAFNDVKGLGKKFFVIIKDFVVNQKQFKKQLEKRNELTDDVNEEE